MNAYNPLTPATELGAWFLAPEALAIIEAIRAQPPARVGKQHYNYQTRDEWTVFEGPLVDALQAVCSAAFQVIDATGDEAALRAFVRSGNVQDVIAAALGTWLPGTHFTCDRERLASIAADLDAALCAKLEDAA